MVCRLLPGLLHLTLSLADFCRLKVSLELGIIDSVSGS